MSRRALGIVVAIAIAAAAFQPFYLRVWRVNRAAMAAMLVDLPYRKTPGLRPFLEAVRARTRPGDAVAVAAPYSWQGGTEYVCARAAYVLAGREVLTMGEVGRVGFIAAYRVNVAPPGFVAVYRDANGMLLRRVPR